MSRYPFPWDLFFRLTRDLPAGRRSLVADCAQMVSRIEPRPVVEGAASIPENGGIVVAANHYQRRGLWIAWPGAVITATIGEARGQTVHWLASGGLRLFQWRAAGPEVPLARQLLGAVAGTYGMVALPLSSGARRASAMRAWLQWLEMGEIVGIFPEGLAGRSTGLRRPEPGFDHLCRLLARRGAQVLPCGIFEEGDALHVRFGPCLTAPADGDTVMREIASLLPPAIRGAYLDGARLPAGSLRGTSGVSGGPLA